MEKNFNNEIDEMDDVLNPDEIIDNTSSDINDDDIVTDEDDNEYVSKEYTDKLISELKTVKEDADTWKNKYMYALSDFETYKRNSQKDKQNTLKYGNEKVIKDILPIIDDFDRAFMHMDAEVKEGVMLIYKNFISVLEKHDVTIISAEPGDKFNENIHEAISVVPAMKDEQKGTIADCVTKGYMLLDKVIRYSKVIVFN
jgi:molecular chaperone GrpE